MRAIKVRAVYNDKLQKITQVESEEAVISANLTFAGFLNFIFSSHPEFHEKYPPGAIGFLVNGKPPKEGTVLQEGDEIYFAGMFNQLRPFPHHIYKNFCQKS